MQPNTGLGMGWRAGGPAAADDSACTSMCMYVWHVEKIRGLSFQCACTMQDCTNGHINYIHYYIHTDSRAADLGSKSAQGCENKE